MPKIKIQFVGTGSGFSTKYGNTSAIVTVDNNGVEKKLLIDCGATTPLRMKQMGIGIEEMDAIFITHLHGDHIHGLEYAGFYGRFVAKKKPHLIFPYKKMKNDLWNKSLRGTMEKADLERLMRLEDYFEYSIVDEQDQYFMFNDVMFSVFRTMHVSKMLSFGLIIGEEDYVVYTSDSLMNDNFLRALVDDGAKLIFHDCQFTNEEGRIHASIDDLSTLPNNVREKICIMHYGDNLDEHYFRIKDLGFSIATPSTAYEFEVK